MLGAMRPLAGQLDFECTPMAATVAGSKGFIAANVAHIHEVTKDWSAERHTAARLVLTAHAVPQAIEQRAPEYRQQVESDAAAIY